MGQRYIDIGKGAHHRIDGDQIAVVHVAVSIVGTGVLKCYCRMLWREVIALSIANDQVEV